MIADEFTQNLKIKILTEAKEQIKQNLKPEIDALTCKQCNLQTYVITGFSDDEKTIIAHVKCTNCGFCGDFFVHLIKDKFDSELNSVLDGIQNLEDKIEEINYKFNS